MSEGPKSTLPVWLIVSLIVNALLIGLLIGGGLGQRKAGPPPAMQGGEQALMRGIDRTVPDDQRRALRRAFRRAFMETRDERLRVRDARQELANRLSADEYDAAAVQQAFKDLREADASMKAGLHDELAKQFGALTKEQRQAIIRDLNRRDNRRRRFRDGNRPPPPPRD